MTNDLKKETKDNIIFAIIRFCSLLLGYIFTLLTQSNFQSLCLGLIIITLTIGSDYLILLFTQDKKNGQFFLTVMFFIISAILSLILLMGCIGFLTYDGKLHIINTSQKIIVYTFNSINIDALAILSFFLICVYILEYTGILKRSKVTAVADSA